MSFSYVSINKGGGGDYEPKHDTTNGLKKACKWYLENIK